MSTSIGLFQTIIIFLLYTIPGAGIPVWKLGMGGIEVVILGILIYLINSDLKVIRWFENKKRSRL